MGGIRIVAGADYAGEGISRGLARGLPVYYGDCNLTGEGMGIGGIALRNREYTYFSREWTDSHDDGVFRRTFSLDTRMRWSFLGLPSGPLTRLAESGASVYMRVPRLQPFLLWPLYPVRTLLGIHPVFEPVASARAGHVHVPDCRRARGRPRRAGDPGRRRRYPLPAERDSARHGSRPDGDEGRAGRPPPGWERVGSDGLPVSLVDPVHGVRFSMDRPAASPSVPLTVYRGRERNGDRCWAGFCIELGPLDGSGRSARSAVSYRHCRRGLRVRTVSGVTLVYPYFMSRDPVEKLFPPLGIACLASQPEGDGDRGQRRGLHVRGVRRGRRPYCGITARHRRDLHHGHDEQECLRAARFPSRHASPRRSLSREGRSPR